MGLEAENPEIIERRKQAARLLEAVVDEEITAQVALNRWPYQNPESFIDESDPSLDIAYQALWHFEADEAQQKNELFYLDTQLTLLQQMADTLALGQALPAHMLTAYSPEHRARFFFSQPILTNYQTMGSRQLMRFWQFCQKTVYQAIQALRP